MGQRRKHVTQTAFNQEVEPPTSNQQIVRALGTRGGNIVEVTCKEHLCSLAYKSVNHVGLALL